MGNTSSRGKKPGATERLHTTHPSIQEEHDPSDAEAAEAASQPIADEQKPNLSDMAAEIDNMVADRVPDAKFPNKKKPKEQLNAKSQLALASRLFHHATQGSRIAAKAVLETSHGNQAKVEQLFAISPAHILYVIAKSDVEDYSHRKFKGENKISPWQYAIWADDWHMYTMILEAVDKAAEHSITRGFFHGKTPDEIAELRRHKPYIGRLTEEEVADLRQELLRQYQEVTEQGLNYTIDYEELTGTDPVTQQPVIVQTARTVEVKGETHFDLKGPEFCLWPQDQNFTPEKGKIYVRIEHDSLHYRCISLSGNEATDRIPLADLNCPLTQLTNIDALKPFITPLLKITSERAHTHPEALISAINTYNQQFDNWDWPTRDKHWCHVVGLAQRLLPPPAAQQICEAVELNQDKNFHQPLRRNFQFYNWVTNSLQTWFPLNRLGIDFGIVNYGGLRMAQGCPAEGMVAGGGRGARAARPRGRWQGRNSAALTALCETRTKDVKMLGEQLLAAVQQQDDLAAGSWPSVTS